MWTTIRQVLVFAFVAAGIAWAFQDTYDRATYCIALAVLFQQWVDADEAKP